MSTSSPKGRRRKNDEALRVGGQPELGQDHFVQLAHWQLRIRRQLAGRHRREEGGDL